MTVSVLFACFLAAALLGAAVADTNATKDADEYIRRNKDTVDQRWRLNYHISAPIGWINDPNGFSYYKDQFHMFYQYYPYDSVTGPIHWGHMVSSDLVNWEWVQVALAPDESYDSNGCFSGSAIEYEGDLVLVYTGNVEDENGTVTQKQNMALSDDGVHFVKFSGNPVIPEPHDGVYAFRDPKVWKHGKYFYLIVGNATPDARGRVVLYKSLDLINWEFISTLAESGGDMGYMWECPDFFELNGRFVLLMSPQGITAEGENYRNLYQNGYILGSFNYESGNFSGRGNLGEFVELDHGYDFYAPQTVVAPDGRRIVIGWMDMWDDASVTLLTERYDGWAGALSIPRELTLRNDGFILMNPVEEMSTIRSDSNIGQFYSPGSQMKLSSKSIELEVYANVNEKKTTLIFDLGNETSLEISYEHGMVSMYRTDREDDRSSQWIPKDQLYWRIFVDTSSVELFCGEGDAVFSTRIYPTDDIVVRVEGDEKLYIIQHLLKTTITY